LARSSKSFARTNKRAEAPKHSDASGKVHKHSHCVVIHFAARSSLRNRRPAFPSHTKRETETLMIMKEAEQMQRLTPRERAIAQLVCAGLSNKQIARQLTVTEGTIKVHLHNVYDKLAIRNRTMLALRCAGMCGPI
jgi:RNA polymerase sigma factor (sigma-70 family)